MPGNSDDRALTGVFRQPEPAAAPRFDGHDGQVLSPPRDRPWLATRTGWWAFHDDRARGCFTAVHTADPATNREPLTVTGPTPWALEEHLGFALPWQLHRSLSGLRRSGPIILPGDTATRSPDPPAAPSPPGGATAAASSQQPAAGPVHGIHDVRPTSESGLYLPGDPPTTVSYATAMRTGPAHRRIWHAGAVRLEVIPTGATGGDTYAYRLSHDDEVLFAGEDLVTGAPEHAAHDDSIRDLIYLLATHDPDALAMTPVQRRFIDHHGEQLCRAVTPPPIPYPAGTRVTDIHSPTGRLGTIRFTTTDTEGTATSYGWRPDLADLPGHPWYNQPYAAIISPASHLRPTIEGTDVGLARWNPDRPLAYGALVALPTPDGAATRTATVIRTYHTPAGISYQLQPHDHPAAQLAVAATALTPIRGTAWPTPAALRAARDTAGILTDPRETIDVAVANQPDIHHDPTSTPHHPAGHLAPALHITGDTAHIRDADHGLLHAPLDRFTAALTHTDYDLIILLYDHHATDTLTGAEPPATLAALVARNQTIPLDPPADNTLVENTLTDTIPPTPQIPPTLNPPAL
jgi:hypothetical protein